LQSPIEPVGYATEITNTVHRKQLNSSLWDSLTVESFIYKGDFIRLGSFSSATLIIGKSTVYLSENTLINISSDTTLVIGDNIYNLSENTIISITSNNEGTHFKVE
jgi:hypothetical protein